MICERSSRVTAIVRTYRKWVMRPELPMADRGSIEGTPLRDLGLSIAAARSPISSAPFRKS